MLITILCSPPGMAQQGSCRHRLRPRCCPWWATLTLRASRLSTRSVCVTYVRPCCCCCSRVHSWAIWVVYQYIPNILLILYVFSHSVATSPVLFCFAGMPSSSVGKVLGHQWLSRWLKVKETGKCLIKDHIVEHDCPQINSSQRWCLCKKRTCGWKPRRPGQQQVFFL